MPEYVSRLPSSETGKLLLNSGQLAKLHLVMQQEQYDSAFILSVQMQIEYIT